MIIAAIVAILQLLDPGISGNKNTCILRQYCDNTAAILLQHFHFGKGEHKFFHTYKMHFFLLITT